MSGQDIQKKTFEILTDKMISSAMVIMRKTRGNKTESPQALENAVGDVVAEHLRKENEVITDLLKRFEK